MSYSSTVFQPEATGFQLASATHKLPLSAICLTKFDVKRGNSLVWSASVSKDIDLKNIEFKTLPSGIHEVEQDCVSFVIPKRSSEFYYGVAVFSQNGLKLVSEETNGHIDRGKVSMYSLAVIVDPNQREQLGNHSFYNWKPNKFICANEYIDDLLRLMRQWDDTESLEVLEHYFNSKKLQAEPPSSSAFPQKSAKIIQGVWTPNSYDLNDECTSKEENSCITPQRSWLYFIPDFFRQLGPLVFTLWKSCLLRERILIVNERGQPFERCNALVYCLSILSLIPKQLAERFPGHSEPIQTLYTVGITDLDYLTELVSEALGSHRDNYELPSFISCTSDEILAYRAELFDVVVRLSRHSEIEVLRFQERVKATPREWELFRHLSADYIYREYSEAELGRFLLNVEPLSWSQYIIDAFFWWTTAGYFQPSYHSYDVNRNYEPVVEKSELEIVLTILDYFHERTTLLFEKLHTALQAHDEHTDGTAFVVTPIFLAECGLDLFSPQDTKFITSLCERWFGRPVQVRIVDCRVLC